MSWGVNVTAESKVTVELLTLAFLTRFVRILPQTNSESSYIQKMRFELHGCPWPYKTILPVCKYKCTTSVSLWACVSTGLV